MDITLPENSAWYERYKFDIPVFHLNGQFLMMHRVNISKLEKQLQKLEQQDARGWWMPSWFSTLAVQKASSWGNDHGLKLLLSLSHSPNDVLNSVVSSKCWLSSPDWSTSVGTVYLLAFYKIRGVYWWKRDDGGWKKSIFLFLYLYGNISHSLDSAVYRKKALHPCCCPKGLTF